MSNEESNPAAAPNDGGGEINVMDEFRAGVTATLRSWSALRAAVESGWGGPESQAKAEDLRQNIYSIMDGTSFPPKIELWDLEDNLAIYMEEEFSVVLEDDSEKQVAAMLWHMYEACHKGDMSLARQAVESARRVEAVSATCPVHVQASEQDEESDDDDAMDTNDSPTISVTSAAQDYASSMLFGSPKKVAAAPEKPVRQLGQEDDDSEKPHAQVLDDDGFAPVQTKRRNKK
jgi:pre-rRNA-processing protein TSR2